jgi:hypothetical protein
MRICHPPENVSAGLSKSAFCETETLEYLGDPQVDRVSLFAPEEFRQVVVADEQGLVLTVRQRGIGEGVFDALDLRPRVEERAERKRGLVGERASTMFEAVLRQVSDRQT